MKAYEYYAEIMPDGHLSLPEDLKNKVSRESKIRVMLLLEDEENEWNDMTISQFLNGYSVGDAVYDKL